MKSMMRKEIKSGLMKKVMKYKQMKMETLIDTIKQGIQLTKMKNKLIKVEIKKMAGNQMKVLEITQFFRSQLNREKLNLRLKNSITTKNNTTKWFNKVNLI